MAAPLLAEKLYTAEEFLALAAAADYELDDGRLVEWSVGATAGWVAAGFIGVLGQFNRTDRLGHLFAGSHLRIYGEQPRIPRAAVTYIRRDRLPVVPRGLLETPPDFIVEVVSFADGAQYLDKKVQGYRSVGVPLVWVVYPESQGVVVHRPGRFSERFTVDDTITGEEALPGFSCRVADLFPALD